MSLITAIRKAPYAFEKSQGEDVLKSYPDLPEPAQKLICAVAGCSPYLRSLLVKECEWLNNNWGIEPNAILDSILTDAGSNDPEALMALLRRGKRRIALLTALCDLGGVWSLNEVTAALTRYADFAVNCTLKALIKKEISRGKLPGLTDKDVATAGGISVLAMGKMGAYELNYSSDIDLIVLFDESRHSAADFDAIRTGFIKITRRMTKILSDVTPQGYVFRTDLRLRPDPAVTPVCVAMEAAERYYESLGRTWERAAFIKARPCAGDLAAGRAFLKSLIPFVWRKHLDFVAIQDAHDMRLRIRHHKGLGGPIILPGHNLKLGRGGIREIEFFTQTRQLIAGGRDKDLRNPDTVGGLRSLAQKNWIPKQTAEDLISAYRAHRSLEHRIQMMQDIQTHDLPSSSENMARLAAFSGFKSVKEFAHDVTQRLEHVDTLIEKFFVQESVTQLEVVLTKTSQKIVDDWQTLPALKTPRAKELFERLKPRMFSRLETALDPGEGLNHLDQFFRKLPSGVQLLSLFEANPQILDLLVDICATAPSLSGYLSRNPQVLDAVLSGDFFEPLPDKETLESELNSLLEDVTNYEDALNIVRRWNREKHFRVGVLQLTGYALAAEAGAAYSALAETCLLCLYPRVAQNFAVRHGKIPGLGAAVIALGKFGSEEMTATSDLDLIVIYDGPDGVVSDGKKSLDIKVYFARFTQALISALSAPTAEGRLYEVDMRLRPSGRKGPVATSLASFENYQRNEARTWEHLALTRARVVAGKAELRTKTEELRLTVLLLERDREKVVCDVRDMRTKLAETKSSHADIWDIKSHPGGLLDIELLTQALALLCHCQKQHPQEQLKNAVDYQLVGRSDFECLLTAHKLLAQLQQISRLVVQGKFSPDLIGKGAQSRILKVTGFGDVDALKKALVESMMGSNKIIAEFFS